MANKPTIDVSRNSNATASGVIPKWDGTYLFDDPLLYFDKPYPGNVSHSGSEQPRVVSGTERGQVHSAIEDKRINSYRAY